MSLAPRLVVVTAESAAAGPAVRRILVEHTDQVALVIISHPDEAGSFVHETVTHLRRSGPLFVWFLFVNFTLYRVLNWVGDRSIGRGNPRGLARFCDALSVPWCITDDINHPDTREKIGAVDPDVLVVCYFEQILRDEVITIPRIGVLNVHTAHLPAHRGLFPEIWAIAAGDTEIGVTVHEIVDRRIDAGPIKAQRLIALDDGRSVLEMSQIAHRCGASLLAESLDNLSSGWTVNASEVVESYHSFPDRQTLRKLKRRRMARVRDLLRNQ